VWQQEHTHRIFIFFFSPLLHRACWFNHFFNLPTNAHLIRFKNTKNLILKYLTLASTCFGLFWNHPQRACKLHFAKLLRWDLLNYIRYKIVQFVAICQFVPSVCVSGSPDTHTDKMWCQVTKLLRWDLLIYIRYKIMWFVAVYWFVLSVCVSGSSDTHTDGMWCQVTKMGSVDLHSL